MAIVVTLVVSTAGCGSPSPSGDSKTSESTATPAASPQSETAEQSGAQSATQATPESGGEQPTQVQDLGDVELKGLNTPWQGDFDEIASGRRRFIRALVPLSKTLYYLDGPEQHGIAFESLREFERVLGASKGVVKPKVVIIPTTRDRLFPALTEGLGDIAVAGLTITESRGAVVEFSEPTIGNVKHVVVTGPNAPPISSLGDLAGRDVFVRRSSSYYEELVDLNKRFASEGKQPVVIKAADELLEDEDLLEMVDAGIIPITVVKDFQARFLSQLYDRAQVHNEITIGTNGQLAWAMRKNSPGLHKVVNDFIRTHKVGTMFGNVMMKRYLGSVERLKNPTTEEERRKLQTLRAFFEKYGDQYDMDWILMAAQGYQESRLDQSVKSHVGAIGIMQVKPETAGDMGIRDIDKAENNIHAGVKYLRFMIDRYYKDEPMDKLNKGLFALASYNAGPARVRRLRAKTEAIGLNPNVWFRNVEVVASKEIGRETVDYVSNIFKYYTAYKMIALQRQQSSSTSGSR